MSRRAREHNFSMTSVQHVMIFKIYHNLIYLRSDLQLVISLLSSPFSACEASLIGRGHEMCAGRTGSLIARREFLLFSCAKSNSSRSNLVSYDSFCHSPQDLSPLFSLLPINAGWKFFTHFHASSEEFSLWRKIAE